jgi:Phospholipase_D-nuclease N-terminal
MAFLAGGIMALIILAVVILTSVFWIWMLVDCITNPRLRDTEKVIWVLVIIFTHIIGALIYFFVGRDR